MPNIILTTYCNLKCPYCFATTLKNTEKQQNITIKQLNHILDWLEPTIKISKDRIGLIGGEPTLHPQFKEILQIISNFSKNNKNDYILFSNGIKIYKYIDELPLETILLINYNHPSIISKQQQQELNESLKLLTLYNYNFALGCNICQSINNYNFFWEAVLKYDIKYVRVAIASPICLVNKNDYFLSLKQKFINFIQTGEKYNTIIEIDCSQIPLQYFSASEKLLVNNYLKNRHSCCTPVIDITPDFKATGCFGCYNLIDLQQYNNLNEVKNEFIQYRKKFSQQHQNDIFINGCIPR